MHATLDIIHVGEHLINVLSEENKSSGNKSKSICCNNTLHIICFDMFSDSYIFSNPKNNDTLYYVTTLYINYNFILH